jgi:hypothetical protein
MSFVTFLLITVYCVGILSVRDFIPFEKPEPIVNQTAGITILVFAGDVLLQEATVSIAGEKQDNMFHDWVTQKVKAFEIEHGALSRHPHVYLNVENPAFMPDVKKELSLKWTIDTGSQQTLVSKNDVAALNLGNAGPCTSIFGGGQMLTGFKSYMRLIDPDDSSNSHEIAVCVQDTQWNLLTLNYLKLINKCLCFDGFTKCKTDDV